MIRAGGDGKKQRQKDTHTKHNGERNVGLRAMLRAPTNAINHRSSVATRGKNGSRPMKKDDSITTICCLRLVIHNGTKSSGTEFSRIHYSDFKNRKVVQTCFETVFNHYYGTRTCFL
jgi:hypothetical protein